MKRIVLLLALIVMVFPATLFAQWHELPGPSAGSVNDFCEIAGSNGGEIYAATPNGVYRTMDHAKSWQLMGLRGHYVSTITQYITPVAEILLAIVSNGTGENWMLFRSEDSARSWDTIFVETQKYTYVTNFGETLGLILGVIQDDNDVVIAIPGVMSDTTSGIYRSADIGHTWSHQALAPNSVFTLSDFTLGNGTILGIADDTVWTMPSHGTAWTPTNYPYWHHPRSLEFFGQDLFVGDIGRMDISTNNGVTWLNPPNVGLDTNQDLISTFAVNGLTIIAAVNTTAYRSMDGAGTWQQVGEFPPIDGQIKYIDNLFFSGTFSGVLTSADGINWVYQSSGIAGGTLSLASDDSTLFADTYRGIFRSTDHGETWIDPIGIRDLVNNRGDLFLETIRNNVFAFASRIPQTGLWRWDDSLWHLLVDKPIISVAEDSLAIFAVTIGPLQDSGLGIIRSLDNGVTWTPANNGISFNNYETVQLVLSGNDLDFAFTSKGSVYASSDEGDSWNLITTQSTLADDYSVAFASNKIYLSTSDGQLLFSSSDYGATWNTVNLSDPTSLWNFGSGIIAQSFDSLYVVNGTSVTLLSDSLKSSAYFGFTSDDSLVYVSPLSSGGLGDIYAEPLTSLPLAVTPSPIAPAFLNLSVFPNPSNGVATISFSLPERENISLKLFDERGVKVATYFDGIAGSGEIQVPIDAAGLSAGSYIAVLTTREGTAVARVAILPK